MKKVLKIIGIGREDIIDHDGCYKQPAELGNGIYRFCPG